MVAIQLQNITKRYEGHAAVDAVSLDIAPGEFLTLLGPSGCGKSTTLRIVAGLTQPDGGRILMEGRDVTRMSPAERRIGMVFQSLALFPHLSVLDNVAFGLKMRGVDAEERSKRAARALEVVHLDGFGKRLPRQLSGGQQQRVALARALVIEPSVLILDEPFAALDRKLREAMQQELRRISRELKITTLFVTHDQEEALILSDWIAVMRNGKVEQFGRSGEIYERPRTRFVADFMGVANFLTLRVAGAGPEGATLSGGGLAFTGPTHAGLVQGGSVDIALRPDRISLAEVGNAVVPGLEPATVTEAIYHGFGSSYTLALASGQTITVREINEGTGRSRFNPGDRVLPQVAANAVCYLNG